MWLCEQVWLYVKFGHALVFGDVCVRWHVLVMRCLCVVMWDVGAYGDVMVEVYSGVLERGVRAGECERL